MTQSPATQREPAEAATRQPGPLPGHGSARHHAGPEAGLIARLVAKDAAACRALVTRHQRTLQSLAGTILRNPSSIEEVVQETWLAVFANIDRFEGRSALSTWIIEILLNKARSRASRDGRSVTFSELASASVEDEPRDLVEPDRFLADGHWAVPLGNWGTVDPERIVAGRELWAHVMHAMDGLPPAQRAVIVMRDVNGMTNDEVALLFDLSHSRVRTLLHRGRARLRKVVDALV